MFKLTPSGNLTVLHSFAGGSDGAFPGLGSLIADAAGNLYGMTVEGDVGGVGGSSPCFASGAIGCGTVFKVTPSGTETVLYPAAATGPSRLRCRLRGCRFLKWPIRLGDFGGTHSRGRERQQTLNFIC